MSTPGLSSPRENCGVEGQAVAVYVVTPEPKILDVQRIYYQGVVCPIDLSALGGLSTG
jgi:hypothetical protein